MLKKKITRREFLKNVGIAGGALFFAEKIAFNIFAEIEDANISEVAIVKGMNLQEMTRKAIDLIGGISSMVKPKDRVFIKPNYITGGLEGHDPVASGEIPHPDVVATIAEECIKSGASQVIIGEWVERPPMIKFGGEDGKDGAQLESRIILINRKYGERIFLINLIEHTSYFHYVPSLTSLKWLAIPNLVYEADVIISIPVLKTHHKPSPFSFGMKNFMGIMPSTLYGEPRSKLHDVGVHQIIVDINKSLKPALTVISGAYGMEGEGVTVYFGGKPVDVSKRLGEFLVIAGKDPVATDATAARIISENWLPVSDDKDLGVPFFVEHFRLAYQQGLGEIRESKIRIKGASLKKVSMTWEMPSSYPEMP